MAGERGILKALCVFCGANTGADPAFVAAAQRLGTLLAQRKITLVFGGGRVGLMGALSGAAFAAGGKVIGIIPTALQKKELAYDGVDLSELRVVSSMHERKAMMAELADGFVALPGGFGTFEEFCEMVTWSQLGIHRKPCGLVNVNGYYDGLLALFDHAVDQGLIKPTHRSLVVAERDPEALLDAVAAWQPPKLEFRLDWKAS
jgi:uncharacterized protein (TIGR00730 family)